MQNVERRTQNGGTMNENFRVLRKQARAAFTLVEMLIAMALTLILVYAIAEFYAYIGNAVRDGRATIEMGGQLRAATAQLNEDLQSLTLRPTPWIDRDTSSGYATFYEGPHSDTYPDGTSDIYSDTTPANNVPDIIENTNGTNLVGDGDDVLAFTIRAKDVPFQAQVWDGMANVRVQSQFAEVVWYTTFADLNNNNTWEINEPRFLCRRQLLIVPGLNLRMQGNLAQFRQTTEVSFHLNSSSQPVANSLADLALRENRFGCVAGATANSPHVLAWNPTNLPTLNVYSFGGAKFGEDRVLANLLAFDVRVFDPLAPIYEDAGRVTALTPGDIGYRNLLSSGSATAIGYGAFVDLNYNRTGMPGTSIFSGGPSAAFNIPAPTAMAPTPYNFVYWDTWPTYYEIHGPGTGRAYNGLDDAVGGVASNGVDDPGERETQPPYFVPLRGIQVRIRMYEPQTRQMRQATVGADFIGD
jgi:prepilin-type N-terminal cleavage/methylation domain-containing protein